jgi:hypothetical protein
MKQKNDSKIIANHEQVAHTKRQAEVKNTSAWRDPNMRFFFTLPTIHTAA